MTLINLLDDVWHFFRVGSQVILQVLPLISVVWMIAVYVRLGRLKP